MQPGTTLAAIVALEGQLYFVSPNSACRGIDLYRRYALAALGPREAERLLRATGISTLRPSNIANAPSHSAKACPRPSARCTFGA